jgi:predicted ester cyclase
MAGPDPRTLYTRLLAAMNARDFAAAEALMAPDAVNHTPIPGEPPGIEGFHYRMGVLTQAFPDLRFVTEDVVSEGERIATRGAIVGTNGGSFMGAPPTGRPVRVPYIDLLRFVDGKMTEHWVQADFVGLMQQLGLAPSPSA